MNKAVSGFTFIEVVVVIVILGVLAAFAFPRFASMDVEARKTAVSALNELIPAVSAFVCVSSSQGARSIVPYRPSEADAEHSA